MSDGGDSPVGLDIAGDGGPDAPEHEDGEEEREEYVPRYGAKGLLHPSDRSQTFLRPSFFRPPNSARSDVKDGGGGGNGIHETLATESTLSWLVRTSFASSAGLTAADGEKSNGKKEEEENIYERWWGSRAEPRPWSERPQVKRRRTVPPEQEERWVRTREVSKFIISQALRASTPIAALSANSTISL